ncbi:glycosyltransferase family 2 protein, partial [Xanthomonas campestris pv. campestris]|nr:glycosyltransferase family 2 protein [Xanthomonas campestris pv. campestris]
MSTPIALRCALVLETNNLRGGDAAHNAVLESLQRAVAALAAQTVPLTALAQLIVTHDGLSETACAALSGIAGRPVTFVRIAHTTGYYEAKNSGFAATDPALCDYVIFADADCLPAADWLAELLLPFSTQPQLAAVAGRTSYAATLVGTALTTLDFMYFPSPLQPQATRNF